MIIQGKPTVSPPMRVNNFTSTKWNPTNNNNTSTKWKPVVSGVTDNQRRITYTLREASNNPALPPTIRKKRCLRLRIRDSSPSTAVVVSSAVSVWHSCRLAQKQILIGHSGSTLWLTARLDKNQYNKPTRGHDEHDEAMMRPAWWAKYIVIV